MKMKEVFLYILFAVSYLTLCIYLFYELDRKYLVEVPNSFWGIIFLVAMLVRVVTEKKSKTWWFILTLLFPIIQLALLLSPALHQQVLELYN
jgi:hypothetical protein